MSFWSNPLGSIQGSLNSPKGLGELALIGTAAYFAPEIMAYLGGGAEAAGAAGAATPIGVDMSEGYGATGSGASALTNLGGAGPAAIATGAPIDQAAINAGTNSLVAAGAGAGAAAINPWVLGGAGALGGMLLAGQPKNNQPGPVVDHGPLSLLHDPRPVQYPTAPYQYQPVQHAASGGLMQLTNNPNPPMAYNMTPTYNSATSTPVPQSVYNFAGGGSTGELDLGSYSDGGRMLKGPGDGMSDSIPATIAGHQPARLANDEFVVPADVVSHLGNGSSDAGAKKLYDMMDRVRRARTGKPKQAKAIHPERYMPG